MVTRASGKAAADKPAKKTKSGGGAKKKLTAFNKFMQTEMARLKETQPDIQHKERHVAVFVIDGHLLLISNNRFRLATENWKKSKENPKAA